MRAHHPLGLLLSGFPSSEIRVRLSTMRIRGPPANRCRVHRGGAPDAQNEHPNADRHRHGSAARYWAIMTLVPVPGTGAVGAVALATPDASLAAWLDRTCSAITLAGVEDVGPGRSPFHGSGNRYGDARRLRGTMDRVAATVDGAARGTLRVGSIAMVGGLIWNWAFPIKKNLWTSSYALFTAGMAACDRHLHLGDRRAALHGWTKPFVIFA